MTLVQFRLAGQAFALELDSVVQVLRMVKMRHLASLPSDVLGALTLQGEIVPVLDLRPRLGFEPRPATDSSPLLIVKCRGCRLAVLVDYVDGVVRADQPLTSGTGWDCMRGLVTVDGQVVAVMDADKLPSAGIEALLPSLATEFLPKANPFLD